MLPGIRSIHAILKFHSSVVKESQRQGDRCLSIILEGISSPNLHIPAYAQKVRNVAYRCFETILNNYSEFLSIDTKENGTNQGDRGLISYTTVVSAVLTAIEGEKDPRNLILSFDLSRLVLLHLGNSDEGVAVLNPFLEEIFDIISCYYPIEFEPPKDDKFKITSKELKDRLNN